MSKRISTYREAFRYIDTPRDKFRLLRDGERSCNIICNNFPPITIRTRSARSRSVLSARSIRASNIMRSCPDARHVKKSREDNSYTEILCCDIRPAAEVLLTRDGRRVRIRARSRSRIHESNEYGMRDQFRRQIKRAQDRGRKKRRNPMHRIMAHDRT